MSEQQSIAEKDAVLAATLTPDAEHDVASALQELADAWPNDGILMPLCIWGCNWSAGPMRDTPENARLLGPIVRAHKAECPGRVLPPAGGRQSEAGR